MYTVDMFLNAPGFVQRESVKAVHVLAKNKGKTVEQINKSLIRSKKLREEQFSIMLEEAKKQTEFYNRKSA